MSGIITAPAFNNLFTATKNNSTMQGFVTAIYEIGTYYSLFVSQEEPIGASSVLFGACAPGSSSLTLGCLFGAIFILSFGDYLGRRRAMMMGSFIMIIGVIIQVTSERNSTPLAQFIVGRTITGVGNGINTSTIPTYQAECSRTSNRGLLICIEGSIFRTSNHAATDDHS